MSQPGPVTVRVVDALWSEITRSADDMDLPKAKWVLGLIAETLYSQKPGYMQLAEGDSDKQDSDEQDSDEEDIRDAGQIGRGTNLHEVEVPGRFARKLAKAAEAAGVSTDQWVERLVTRAADDPSAYEIVMEAIGHNLIEV